MEAKVTGQLAIPTAAAPSVARSLAQVLGKAHAHVAILNADGTVRAISPSLASLLTASEANLIDRPITSWLRVPPDLLSTGGRGEVEIHPTPGTLIKARIDVALLPVKEGLTYRICILAPKRASDSDEPGCTAVGGGPDVRENSGDRGQKTVGKTVLAGRVQIIRLDEIKAARKHLSPHEAEMVHSVAKSIIEKRLTEADIFREGPEDSFIICFDTQDIEHARAKARLISLEIKEHLLGFGKDTHRVTSAVEAVQLDGTRPASDDDLIAQLSARLTASRDLFQQQMSHTADAAIKQARLVLNPVLTARLAQSGMVTAQLGDESSALLPLISDLKTRESIFFQVDFILLSLSVQHLYQFPQEHRSIIIPVSFSTLDKRMYNREYTGLCRDIDHAIRGKMIFELHSLPDDIVDLKLEYILSHISPFSYRTIMRIALGQRLVDFRRHRISILSFQAFTPPRIEQTGFTPLNKFFDTLHRRGCKAMVRDVPDRQTAASFASFGVDFVHTQAIMPPGANCADAMSVFAVGRSIGCG